MPTIKRYANRKLYDTESKRYVTLDDLAAFIREGEEVRVVDYASGEDLTSQTLFQIIFEEQKKIGGLLPQVFLTRMIRAGGSRLGALRARMLAIDPFQTVNEEIRRRIQVLVEQGLASPEEAARFEGLLLNRSGPPGMVHIPITPEGEGVPTTAAADAAIDQAEVEALLKQIETLEQELQQLKK